MTKRRTSPYASGLSGVNDEMHIVVIDEDGEITGTKGEVLEKFEAVSKVLQTLKTSQGSVNYYIDVIYKSSNYIYWMTTTLLVQTGVVRSLQEQLLQT